MRSGRSSRVFATLSVVVLAVFVGGLKAASAPHATAVPAAKQSAPKGNSRGVTVGIEHGKARLMPTPNNATAGAAGGSMPSGPLLYHGGSVMSTGVMNIIVLWNPGQLQDGSPTGYSGQYATLAKQWFTDQPTSPLYMNMNQYSQVVSGITSYISPNVRPTKVITDTTPFPVGQCVHFHTGANCITNANVVTELRHVMAAHALTGGLKHEYFVLTPSGEGSCIDSGCTLPSYSYYCAYHAFSTVSAASTNRFIYANMPYPTDPGGQNCYDPAHQTFPSGDTNADALVNLLSHEEYESVTDPYFDGWYDTSGISGEIGDVCAWQFGPNYPSGGDLQINGHPYDTQAEGDNHNLATGGTGCVYAGP